MNPDCTKKISTAAWLEYHKDRIAANLEKQAELKREMDRVLNCPHCGREELRLHLRDGIHYVLCRRCDARWSSIAELAEDKIGQAA